MDIRPFRIEVPELFGSRRWTTRLPNGPYSFIGDLVSLSWALELIVEPAGETFRREIALAPDGKVIHLYPDDGSGES